MTTGAGITFLITGTGAESEAVAAWDAAGGVKNSVTCTAATYSFTCTGAACTAVAEVHTRGAGARRTVSRFVFGFVNAFNSSAISPREEAHCVS